MKQIKLLMVDDTVNLVGMVKEYFSNNALVFKALKLYGVKKYLSNRLFKNLL